MDGSISLKFGKEFEHVNAQGQWVKGQGHSMKTSSDRQIIVLFQEIGVAEFNGDVRLLIGRWEKFVHMRSTNHDSPPSVIHAFTSDKKLASHLPQILLTVDCLSRSRSHISKNGLKSPFPQCKTSIGNDSDSIKHRAMKLVCSIGFFDMADRMV